MTLLHIIGGICLLLWGTLMVRRGFTRAYGASLHRIIGAGTKNRFSAFLSGLGITALLQSSTATTLLLTSFAKKGLIPLTASLAVIIGADVGTTLIAQVLSLDLSWISPALITAGYIFYKVGEKNSFRKHVSRIIVGLGLMLLALALIRTGAEPIKHSATLPLIMDPLASDPVLTILVATFITLVIHSSLASVLLFASMATGGVTDIHMGILLVLGANFGGALIPLAATWKDGAPARQITVANTAMRVIILLSCLPFLHSLPDILSDIHSNVPRQIIIFHTAFNVALAIVFLPFVSVVSGVFSKLLPLEKESQEKTGPQYLDEQAMDSPVIALASAARETLHMAELIEQMLESVPQAFEDKSESLIRSIKKADNEVDTIYKALKLYMARLPQDGMDMKEVDRYIQILTFSTNLEHIGDIIDKSLMKLAEKNTKTLKDFSDEGFKEIKNFHELVLSNFRKAQAIFLSEDESLARKLIDEKHVVRVAADNTTDKHFKRLQSGWEKSIATSSLHLDIIRDYRQINSYATRIAFAVLEKNKPETEQITE